MPSRFFRRSRAILTGLALCGAATAAVLPATSGAATAAQVPSTGATAATASGPYVVLIAKSDGLYLDIQGASTAKNAVVIQWTSTGSGSEVWHLLNNGQIRNENSGMCLTTDGVAGDQLYQEPCQWSLAANQKWAVIHHKGNRGVVSIDNLHYNLYVDVYGDNTTLGGPIDAWPYNGGYPNQLFQGYLVTDGPKG